MEIIKSSINTLADETLKEMYSELLKGDFRTEDILVMTVIETELENRGVIKLNEDTLEYEFIA